MIDSCRIVPIDIHTKSGTWAMRPRGSAAKRQLPFDEPIPYDLIERIVKLRVTQDAEKAAPKSKTRTSVRCANEVGRGRSTSAISRPGPNSTC